MEGLHLAFLHLLAVIAALGGSFFMVFIFVPISKKDLSEEQFHRLIAKIIRKFHPFLLTCYLGLIMTGAWMITRYKIDAGVNFFSEYGHLLLIKLSLVFVSVMVACYQFFGLGTAIVYWVEEAYESVDRALINRKISRLRLASLLNLGIMAIIVYLGIALTRP